MVSAWQRRLAVAAVVALGSSLYVFGGHGDEPKPEVRRRVAALNDEGIALYERGQYASAIERFEQALELHPSSTDIRTNLGKAHAAYGSRLVEGADSKAKRRDALDRLRQSLLYWAGDAVTHRAIAWCHYHLSEHPAAERALLKSIEFESGSFDSWRLLGIVREEQRSFEGAFAAYEKALELRPNDAILETRLRRARYDRDAIRSFEKLEDGRFSIYFPAELDRSAARKIQATLRKTTEVFTKRWDLPQPKGLVVLCYPPGQFARRTGLHEDVGGAFDGRIRVAFPEELGEGGLELDRVVRHEMIHALLHSAGERPPRWLDEGLAQYLDGDERDLWFPRFRKALAATSNVGVTERESRFRHDDPASWAALYLHSYFFVKHLAKTRSEFRLDMLVRSVRSGKSWDAAFLAVYAQSPADIDREWRRSLLEDGK